jgi:hypothetical protein
VRPWRSTLTPLLAEGHVTESHGPYPLIAVDERGPFVMYNFNLEAVVRPDGTTLSAEASWKYVRTLLQGELGLESPAIYTHRWQEGDLLLWDNLATIHTATAECLYDATDERLLHRVRLRSKQPPRPYNLQLDPSAATMSFSDRE